MATKAGITNPFSITSYMGKEYFCDREAETNQLREALYNRRNITLVSPRRMGKTGLIRHLFEQISPKEAYCFYIDIYNTSNLCDFTRVFAEAVLTKQLTPFSERVWKEMTRFFGSLRPVLSADPITGMPQCSVEIQPDNAEMTLSQLFSYLEHANKRCYVAFDEFQTIADYPEGKAEATLRTYIQHLNNVNFIFAGSKKHVMLQMFSSVGRPFYQSTQLMSIGAIGEDAYFSFAASHLKAHKQTITKETFHDLYSLVSGHTWYVQVLLNRLYQSGIKDIDYAVVLLVLNQILEEQIPVYQTYMHLLTDKQTAVMRAIAKEGIVHEPGSSKFLQKHTLGAYSTVRSVILSLAEKELLYIEEDGIYDRFWAIWLKNN